MVYDRKTTFNYYEACGDEEELLPIVEPLCQCHMYKRRRRILEVAMISFLVPMVTLDLDRCVGSRKTSLFLIQILLLSTWRHSMYKRRRRFLEEPMISFLHPMTILDLDGCRFSTTPFDYYEDAETKGRWNNRETNNRVEYKK